MHLKLHEYAHIRMRFKNDYNDYFFGFIRKYLNIRIYGSNAKRHNTNEITQWNVLNFQTYDTIR